MTQADASVRMPLDRATAKRTATTWRPVLPMFSSSTLGRIRPNARVRPSQNSDSEANGSVRAKIRRRAGPEESDSPKVGAITSARPNAATEVTTVAIATGRQAMWTVARISVDRRSAT